MEIYWIENKAKCGPSTVPDIIRRIQLEEIKETCLAWHTGCKNWMPIIELPALSDFIHSNVTSAKDDEVDDKQEEGQELSFSSFIHENGANASKLDTEQESENKTTDADIDEGKDESSDSSQDTLIITKLPSPSSAQRFYARMIDITLYLMLYMLIIYTLGIPFSRELSFSSSIAWLPYIIIETACLHFWRKTPGKAFMGIEVHYAAEFENRIPISKCLRRSIMVYILGTGMIFVFLPLFFIAMAISWWILRSRGSTPWDNRTGCILIQTKPVSILRNMGATVICAIAFTCTGQFILPWLPAIYAEMVKISPEDAASFRAFMPTEIQKLLPIITEKQKNELGFEQSSPINSHSSVSPTESSSENASENAIENKKVNSTNLSPTIITNSTEA